MVVVVVVEMLSVFLMEIKEPTAAELETAAAEEPVVAVVVVVVEQLLHQGKEQGEMEEY
jgi:hypothetical protein